MCEWLWVVDSKGETPYMEEIPSGLCCGSRRGGPYRFACLVGYLNIDPLGEVLAKLTLNFVTELYL